MQQCSAASHYPCCRRPVESQSCARGSLLGVVSTASSECKGHQSSVLPIQVRGRGRRHKEGSSTSPWFLRICQRVGCLGSRLVAAMSFFLSGVIPIGCRDPPQVGPGPFQSLP